MEKKNSRLHKAGINEKKDVIALIAISLVSAITAILLIRFGMLPLLIRY